MRGNGLPSPLQAGGRLEPAARLLMVGLSCTDHVWRVGAFPPVGSRTDASAYRTQGGGPAATAAVAAAVLGGSVELVAVHGDDAAAEQALRELQRYGVGVAGVHREPGATSFVSAVLVAESGERWIFPYRGSGLPDGARLLGPIRPEEFDAVLVDLRHPRLCEAAARRARTAGVPVVVDLGNLRSFEISAQADHVFASQECAHELLGRDDPAAALPLLRQRPGQVVGVTMGPEGVIFDAGEGARHQNAFEVDAVDTTGAGDVFHGAYALAVARAEAVEAAVAFASAAAALACTAFGSRDGIPSAAELEQFLRERTPGLRPGPLGG